MKPKLINEINRINGLMGLELINESGVPGLSFLRRLISMADDDVAIRLFRQMDGQIDDDLVRRLRNGDDLTASQARRLSRNINSESLAKAILDNPRILGTGHRDIMERVEREIISGDVNPFEIPMRIDKYYDNLAKEGYMLEGIDADTLEMLKKEQKSRISKNTADSLPKFGEADRLNLPDGVDAPNLERKYNTTVERYEAWREKAVEKYSYLQDFSPEQFDIMMDNAAKDNIREETLNELKRIRQKNQHWYRDLPAKKKAALWVSVIPMTAGMVDYVIPATAYLYYDMLTGMGPSRTWNLMDDNLGHNDGEKAPILQKKILTKDDVKDHLISNYTIDGPTFDDYYSISISKDKDYAFVEGPKTFDVTLSDGKITSKKY